MGMYNEAYKKCPRCGHRGYVQIKPQIVLGFGGFDLDNPKDLAEALTIDELKELRESLREGHNKLQCQSETCSHSFFAHATAEDPDEKERLAREICG